MYYVYYNSDGVITSVSNEDFSGKDKIEIDFETYTDFTSGAKDMFSFAVIENVKQKGKFILLNKAELIDEPKQNSGFIKIKKSVKNGLVFTQNKKKGEIVIKEKVDDYDASLILAGEPYVNTYYCVSLSNTYVLLDKFSIDLQDVIKKQKITIPVNSAKQDIRLMCHSNFLEHTHIIRG